MSSALPSRGPHVKDIFVQNGPGTSFQYDQKESKSSYNISSKKKSKAPSPPSGLGQYKPKILSADTDGIVQINHQASSLTTTNDETCTLPVRPPRHSKGKAPMSPLNNSNIPKDVPTNKPFIIGDKDTPMVLHSPQEDVVSEPEHGDDHHLLTSLEGMPGYDQQGTENPLFHMHDVEEEDEVAMDIGETGSVSNAESENVYSTIQQDHIYLNSDAHHSEPQTRAHKEDEPEGIFIPAPDYDEEEKTMVLEEEEQGDLDPALHSSGRHKGQGVYKEYQGEDFAQYLSDEDLPLGMNQTFTARPKRPANMHNIDRKSKSEAKRPHYKKRDSMLASSGIESRGGKGKKSREKIFSGSHSLRDFSFSDSKFGTVNGTNKRNSSARSLSHDSTNEEADMFVVTENSYEQFLQQRNGELPLDTFDCQGSRLVDDHPFGQAAQGLPEQPPRYPRASGHGDSLWKKLTWKFKSKVR